MTGKQQGEKTMRIMGILLAGAAATGMAAGAAQAETWDMPMAYPATNFHSENAQAFADCVAEGTDGGLEIVIHAGGSLFSGADIKRAVQTGQAPIGERLLSAHENENVLFGIDSIPFLATSFEESERLWEAARPELERVLEEQELVYLYAVPWPPQGLYTNQPIESADDLEGVRFRAYNPGTARIAELAGMSPVQIEAAELTQALATGVVESFISSGATGVDSAVWEQLSHFYDVQAWLPRNAVFANRSAWEGLDEETRAAVTTCADEAAARGLEQVQELTGGYLETLAENGMTVEAPSEALRADFASYGETMTEEWLAQAGESGKAIIEAYRAE
jgi:TRAP-type C4-dicarboxylate transport system substrate-binding protein